MAQFDEIDRRILDFLQTNGRMTNRELAASVGLSAAPCWHRVKRLEKLGVIDEYRAVLSASKLKRHIKVLAGVTLTTRTPAARDAFESRILELPDILECYWVGAEHDYKLIVSATDLQCYERFLRDELLSLPSVDNVQSEVTLKEVKNTTALSLDAFLDQPQQEDEEDAASQTDSRVA